MGSFKRLVVERSWDRSTKDLSFVDSPDVDQGPNQTRVRLSNSQLLQVARDAADKVDFRRLTNRQASLRNWKWKSVANGFTAFSHGDGVEADQEVLTTGEMKASLHELQQILSTTTDSNHDSVMRALYKDYIYGTVVHVARQAVDNDPNVDSQLTVKTGSFERSRMFKNHEQWCYVEHFEKARSADAFTVTMTSLDEKNLLTGKMKSGRVDELPDLTAAYQIEKIPSSNSVRVVFFAQASISEEEPMFNPASSTMSYNFGSDNGRSSQSARLKKRQKRLMRLAAGASQLPDIVSRRRFGAQSLANCSTFEARNTRCTCCAKSLRLLARKKRCHICGYMVCHQCWSVNSVENREGMISSVRACSRCVEFVGNADYSRVNNRTRGHIGILPDANVSGGISGLPEAPEPAGKALTNFLHEALNNSSGNKRKSVVSVIRHLLSQDKEEAETRSECSSVSSVSVRLTDDDVKKCSDALDKGMIKVEQVPVEDCVLANSEGRNYPLNTAADTATMSKPPIPSDEQKRLDMIEKGGYAKITDTDELDLICELVAREMNCSTGLVTLINEDEQHVLASNVEPFRQLHMPRDQSFCQHTIMNDKPLLVPHPESDIRFHNLPALAAYDLRFYLGFPLMGEDNQVVGSVCCIDNTSREVTQSQYSSMKKLAETASRVLLTIQAHSQFLVHYYAKESLVMVKSYLRYERSCSFGVIASLEGNVIYDSTGRFAIAPALQDVAVWNVRQGNKVRDLLAPESGGGQVTALALSPDGNDVACGYSTGAVRVFKLATGAMLVTLDGHKGAVEALAYRADGAELASGSRDTDVIVWDLVSQTGLFRLKGHKDAVTALAFVAPTTLTSSSKDTLVKVWDLETQHCVQTCVGHRNEVWSLAVNPKGDRLLTGASDNQLRVWSVQTQEDQSETGENVKLMGSIYRQSNDRAARVMYSPKGDLVGVQSAGKTVEVYRVRSAEEIKKKQQRREKRQREKAKKKQQQAEEAGKDKKLVIPKVQEADEEDANDNSATDELELLCVVRSSHRVKSFVFSPDVAKDGTTSIMLGLQNNSIETYTLSPSAEVLDDRYGKSHALTLSGHRSDVRQVAVSSDDQLILSLSGASVKIWNARSLQCIRTLSDGLSLALSAVFAPGNMHVVVGTKLGALLLFDLNSGECIWKDDEAHNGSAVWSIDVRPDGRGIVTGGADQHVNFWDFEMHRPDDAEPNSALRLGLSHARMLKMSDDVLCVRFSNTKDAKKLVVAVALLDCTVKVFHDDSLKFFVSLYGHKLPVMSMDISSDDSMLVTASADKNVKLWGLDFGDCHKSIFAHQDSIMCVRFVRKTHYFFTASKDKSICYWDGDHFERILKIDRQHFGEVWGLAVSSDGSFVVSCSQDRSLVKYMRTEDQVFIEEEKEKEMEQLFEDELANNSNGKGPALGKEKDDEGDKDNSASAAKRTIESVRAGESLMEAIDLTESELQAIIDFERVQKKKTKEAAAVAKKLKQEEKKALKEAKGNALPGSEQANSDNEEAPSKPKKETRPPNMLLLGYSPLKYMLNTLRRIRPHDMEEALIVLPFDYVERLIRLLLQLISSHLEVEFCCHVLLFLLKLHNSAICARVGLFNELELLWQRLRTQLVENKNRIGFNLAGLKYLKRTIDEERTGFVQEIAATPASGAGRNKKKRKVAATEA
ncbi:hypothetical protein JM18_003860 [Phytophthora kernoviae]|uniref:FYVE-type domain-containing protein n=1 Tax=Phytophthora kernoviae TaxID=325452 RepID=A0A922AQ74_9STRA|nr:hypothetical protein JM18_003860 [Phytophthora kernoviae]